MRRHPDRSQQLRRVPEDLQRRPEDMRQWYLPVILVFVACSSDSTLPDGGGGPDATSGPCGTLGGNLTVCSGACADTKRDPDNCGGCGKKCGASEVCTQGGCSL